MLGPLLSAVAKTFHLLRAKRNRRPTNNAAKKVQAEQKVLFAPCLHSDQIKEGLGLTGFSKNRSAWAPEAQGYVGDYIQ
jgi:hypothetical protein